MVPALPELHFLSRAAGGKSELGNRNTQALASFPNSGPYTSLRACNRCLPLCHDRIVGTEIWHIDAKRLCPARNVCYKGAVPHPEFTHDWYRKAARQRTIRR